MAPRSDNTPPTPRPVSGTAYPAAGSPMASYSDDEASQVIYQPVPIVLHTRTILKLIGPVFLALVSGLAAGLYFYVETRAHMASPAVHLAPGERARLETKDEAATARKQMIDEIGRMNRLTIREIQAEQKQVQIDLKAEMRRYHRRRPR